MDKFIPTDEQWQKMQRHIKSDKYKKEDFFVFETLAVGDKVVPNRYMRLTPELLSVMREDAEKGVSLMLNHNWSQLGVQSIPIGKVFDGRIASSSQDGESTALYTTQYILRDDSKVDGYSKNDIIKLIETGTLADTSVGWGTTRESYICSICGNSYYGNRCEHFAGRKYIVNEETNEVKECVVEARPPKEIHIGNNVLMENSIVFDGAYPNAIIQSSIGEDIETSKGKFKVLEGKQKLSEKDIIIGYSTQGNINLLYKESKEKGGVEEMENENVEELENQGTETVETVETETVAVDSTGIEVSTNIEETIDNTESVATTQEQEGINQENLYTEKDLLEKFGNISDSLDNLVQLAKEGLENRNETIKEALNSGVHAMGNAFNKDVFAKTFSNMQTKDIKEMAETWEKQAKAQFSTTKVSKQTFSENEENVLKVDMKQFKTGNY